MKSFKLLWSYMRGNRLLYVGAVLCIGLSTLFSLIGPLVIRTTIDSVIGNQPFEVGPISQFFDLFGGAEHVKRNLWIPGILLLGSTILRGTFFYLRGRLAALSSETIAKNIRDRLYDHLQHLPYEYHVKAETGDLVQRCTSDVETVRRFLGVQSVDIGNAIFMVSFVTYIMLSLSVQMTLVAMAVVPIIFVFAVIFFRKVKKAFKLADEAEAQMTTVLQENLTAIRVVKAFARQEYEIEKFEFKNAKHRDLVYRLIKLLAYYWSSSDFLCLMQIAMVLVVGAYFTAQGVITLGTLVVFVTYEGMLLWPVRQMGRVITDMGRALVAAERIEAVLDEKEEVMEETGETPSVKGEIVFDNVVFGYEPGRPVLNGVSFQAKPGQTIAILGHTGSGKSSLVHLLARLYDYQEGSIKIDGLELKHIDKKWIRKNVGIVLQEPFLFAKTLKENIRLAKPDASDSEVVSVAQTAAIHDVIISFDRGYETPVGERGVSLSGGQKQRVAIARALINQCPILIFDDSLSAVDTETDAAIRGALKGRTNQATTFIISHRVASLMDADLILVMDHGRIVQSGKHTELILEPGLYKRVWEIQNSLESEFRQTELGEPQGLATNF